MVASPLVSGPPDERLPKDFGKYRLLKRIATGGMAEIFLAHERETPGQSVVVKRILPHLAESADFVSMFLDEARIAARLAHANIVEITDVGQVSGAYYIAMEYIHGEDVRRIYNQAYKLQRSLPLSHSIRVIAEAARGLEFAHTLEDSLTKRKVGVVHRDVSPQNILVTYAGGVKVVDFGIAKAANKVNQTRAGVLKGKYSYMSPEQALGDPIDHRTDIFALGIILYETTTGTRLFKRQNELATLQAVIKCEIVPPSDALPGYPVELEEIVLKSLAKEPRDRHQTSESLSGDLFRFLKSSRLYVEPDAIAEFMADLFADRLAEEAASGQLVLPKEHEVRAEMAVGAPISDGARDGGSRSNGEPSRSAQDASSDVVSVSATHSSPPPPGVADDTHLSARAQATFADDLPPGFRAHDPDEDSLGDGTVPEDEHEDLAARARKQETKASADQAATVVNQAAYQVPAPRIIAPEKPERSSGVVESTQYVRAISGSRTNGSSDRAEGSSDRAEGSIPPSAVAPERPSERASERAPERVLVRPKVRAAPHTSVPPPPGAVPVARPSRPSTGSDEAAAAPPRGLMIGLVILFFLGVVVAVLAGLARSKVAGEQGAAGEGGEVTIQTEPGAVIEHGDKVLGSSGSDGLAGPFRLPAGPQTVRITLAPGSTRERLVHVRAGGVHEIEVRARTGFVRLAVAPWARVKIDGKDVGVTPLPPQTLSEGEHVVQLDNSDLRLRHVRQVLVEADQTFELRVDLNSVGQKY